MPPGPCPCDHPPLPLALSSPGCWMRRVHLPSSRLIVPSLGDSCSENSLGLVINQDETRVISCERQASPGRPAGSRPPSAHADARGSAGADGSRPPGQGRVGGGGGHRGGQSSERSLTSWGPGPAGPQRQGWPRLLSGPHEPCSESPCDGRGSQSTSARIPR